MTLLVAVAAVVVGRGFNNRGCPNWKLIVVNRWRFMRTTPSVVVVLPLLLVVPLSRWVVGREQGNQINGGAEDGEE